MSTRKLYFYEYVKRGPYITAGREIEIGSGVQISPSDRCVRRCIYFGNERVKRAIRRAILKQIALLGGSTTNFQHEAT